MTAGDGLTGIVAVAAAGIVPLTTTKSKRSIEWLERLTYGESSVAHTLKLSLKKSRQQ